MKDREAAVKILNWMKDIRTDLIPEGASVRLASDEEDQHHATDAVIVLPDSEIRVGYRNMSDKGPRKFKIRAMNEGFNTELDKIQSGDCCRWYLCSWYDEKGICGVALINLEAMRLAGDFAHEVVKAGWKWKVDQPDLLTAFIYRYLHWVRDDGYILFEHNFPREPEPPPV
jgi:hypothetical protein